jgi:hypothetical protein
MTTTQAAALILHRASLIELRDALKNAKRWSNAASVATLTAEISRRLGSHYKAHRQAARATNDGALQTGHAAQAHAALTEYAAANNCTTEQAAAAIRAAN